MRFYQVLYQVIVIAAAIAPVIASAAPDEKVSVASHNQIQPPVQPPAAAADVKAIERIRKITLTQDDDARALANLVQLTRELPAATTAQLYYDLANDYLRRGKYNQAANVLQQLLNQHPDESPAPQALVDLVRLYSSSEVMCAEALKHSRKSGKRTQQDPSGMLRYALYTAERTLQNSDKLGNDPALTFQRATATRLSGNLVAAQGRLTRLKRDLQAEPWRTRALAEHWLQSDRNEEPPLPLVFCYPTDAHPHLDGQLSDSCWNGHEPIQFRYDDEFLYLAISFPKAADCAYHADAPPRAYDADLAEHDRIRLRLDADRDYATCNELAVDHRGQTHDRCWHDSSWNPKWLVAAGGDDSRWTIEAAIPWKELAYKTPKMGDAWALSTERLLPNSDASPSEPAFSLLLFQ